MHLRQWLYMQARCMAWLTMWTLPGPVLASTRCVAGHQKACFRIRAGSWAPCMAYRQQDPRAHVKEDAQDQVVSSLVAILQAQGKVRPSDPGPPAHHLPWLH